VFLVFISVGFMFISCLWKSAVASIFHGLDGIMWLPCRIWLLCRKFIGKYINSKCSARQCAVKLDVETLYRDMLRNHLHNTFSLYCIYIIYIGECHYVAMLSSKGKSQ